MLTNFNHKKSVKKMKWQSEAVNQRGTKKENDLQNTTQKTKDRTTTGTQT